MPTSDNNGSANQQVPNGESAQQPAPQVDIKQLAEKVYQLMLAELRLERLRGAALAGRRKGEV